MYKYLSFEKYLSILSKVHFIFFKLGLLKRNRIYDYHYFLKKVIKNRDIIIDIGANLGYFTVIFSKLVGRKGRVYAIEPIKPVANILKKNIKKLENVEIYPFALGKENKKIRMGNNINKNSGYAGSGSHFILKNNQSADIEFEVQMKKTNQLFDFLSKLDFIKCDIEGYESVVIPELESIIVKFKPICLIESKGENRKKILQFFKGKNYSAFVLKNGLLYHTNEKESIDIFFVHKNNTNKIVKYINL